MVIRTILAFFPRYVLYTPMDNSVIVKTHYNTINTQSWELCYTRIIYHQQCMCMWPLENTKT